jgi:hypothetical protein
LTLREKRSPFQQKDTSISMNKYQKIALLVGAIILVLLFGKTITQVGLRTIGSLGALFGKFLIVIVAVILIISAFKKKRRRDDGENK